MKSCANASLEGEILLPNVNARPHTAKNTEKKLEELRIELVARPPHTHPTLHPMIIISFGHFSLFSPEPSSKNPLYIFWGPFNH